MPVRGIPLHDSDEWAIQIPYFHQCSTLLLGLIPPLSEGHAGKYRKRLHRDLSDIWEHWTLFFWRFQSSMLHCVHLILTSEIKFNKMQLFVVIVSKLPFQITYPINNHKIKISRLLSQVMILAILVSSAEYYSCQKAERGKASHHKWSVLHFSWDLGPPIFICASCASRSFSVFRLQKLKKILQ